MAQLPIDEAIVRFKDNEDKFDTFVNLDGTYTTNEVIPRTVQTLPSFMDEMVSRYYAYSAKGAWTTATAYEKQDLVAQGGVTYLCLLDHTSATFATDLSSGKWAVYQGLTRDELASSDAGKGAELVEYQGDTVEDALDKRIPEIGNYASLDAYEGNATSVLIYGVTNIFDGGQGVFRQTTDTPSASNGVYRQDSLGRWWEREYAGEVSPEWFGATGDGATNDSSAMQSALTYAASKGQAVRLSPGKTYNCSGATLDISCNLFGMGSTIKGYLRVTGNDLILENFHLVATNSSIGLYLYGSTTVPTRYYRQKISNVKISFDTGVANGDSFGLYASNIDNLTIVGCNILYGIQLIGCTDYLIDGNIIDGNNYSNNNELIHASLKSIGQIVNNTFINSLDNYIDLYPSGAKTIVSNNRFLGCKTKTGAAVELKVTLTDTSNTSSDTNGWEEQIIISNNYFGNTQAFSAQFTAIISIYYIDSRAIPSFDWANTPRNIIISNNIFDGFDATAHGSSYFAAIYLNTINSAIMSGNIFRDLALGVSSSDMSSCVWVEKCQDIVIDGNRMTMKNGTGVSLHDACTNISVTNNHMLQDLNKSHTLNYGIRITKEGSRPDPTVTYSKFIGNIVYASVAAFRQLYVAAGYMNDCIVSNNVFKEQSTFQFINRCILSNNKFYVGASRPYACEIGNTSAISAHNSITDNQVESNTTTQKPGIAATRLRGSNINGNTVRNATYGILVAGTNTAGELDYLNIKDNFSISQTMVNFPTYSGMVAGDTASLQAANNQKIT